MKRIIISIMVVLSVLNTVGCGAGNGSPRVLKLGGLYLGMNINKACAIIKNIPEWKHISVRREKEDRYPGTCYKIVLEGTMTIIANNKQNVVEIHMMQSFFYNHIDSLGLSQEEFYNMSMSQFVRMFMEKYKIKNMDRVRSNDNAILYSPYGYELTITDSRIILISVKK